LKSDTIRLALILEPRDGIQINQDMMFAAIRPVVAKREFAVVLRGGVRRADDYFGPSSGRDGSSTITATLELTARGAEAIERLSTMGAEAATALARIIDPQRSTVAIGPLHVIEERTGDVLLVISARRNSTLSAEVFFDWWHNQHAPLVRKLLGTIPFGYEQVHVDQTLSRLACERGGLTWQPLDLYETLVASEIETLREMSFDTKLQNALIEDEAGRVRVGSMRGAVMDSVSRA